MARARAYILFIIFVLLSNACNTVPERTENIIQITETPAIVPSSTQSQQPIPMLTSTLEPTDRHVIPSPSATIQPSATKTKIRVLELSNPQLEGEDVLSMQMRLLALGFRELGFASGVFDEQSEVALKHFQWLNHLEMTGKADENTLAWLFSEEAIGIGPRLYAFLGEVVSEQTDPMLLLNSGLTDRLIELKYLEPFSAPEFTEETKSAVEAFQANNDLKVDGSLDYVDWQALFNHWAVDADGGQAYVEPKEVLQTHIFPVDFSPNLLAWDGKKLWVGHESRMDCSMTTVMPVEPEKGLLQRQTPIIVGDCLKGSTPMQEMVFAKDKLFVLFPDGTYTDPSPMMRVFDAKSGLLINEIVPVDCLIDFCLPRSAIGFDGTTIWMTAHDKAYSISAATGQLTGTKRNVNWLTGGMMAFDGKCMWMGSGDAGLTSFSISGGNCPGSEMSWQVGTEGDAVWDGKLLWGVDPYGYLKSFDPKAGSLVKVFSLGAVNSAITYDGERIWVADADANTIQAVHAASGSLGEPIPIGDRPSALLFDGTRLWIANAGNNTVQYILPSEYPMDIVYPTATPTRAVDPTRMPTLASRPFERNLLLTAPYMSGEDVLALQQQLLALGYAEVGNPDGVFGLMTEEAVMHFQSVNELEVDGIVGPMTWERLFGGSAWRP